MSDANGKALRFEPKLLVHGERLGLEFFEPIALIDRVASSSATMLRVSDELEAGMVAIDSVNLATPEAPFGGIEESGHGSELGTEGLDAYFVTKSASLT